MQLIVKLYSDKPSRIAIQYPYEYQAQRAYEAIVSKHPNEHFLAKFELHQHKIVLTLQSEESGIKIVYKDLDYRAEQLMRLKAYYEKGAPLIFVHIYAKANTLYVAKPFRRAEFVTIYEIEVLAALSAGY